MQQSRKESAEGRDEDEHLKFEDNRQELKTEEKEEQRNTSLFL